MVGNVALMPYSAPSVTMGVSERFHGWWVVTIEEIEHPLWPDRFRLHFAPIEDEL